MVPDLDTRMQQGTDHVATSIGSETAVMSIKLSRYYAVGGSAERIWQMLEAPVTPRQIIECLMDEYDIERARCEDEVTTFLGELISEGLVEMRPE